MRVQVSTNIGIKVGPGFEKEDILLDVVRELNPGQKTIVICEKRESCDLLCKEFRGGRFRSHSVHSGHLWWQRNIIADKFKDGRFNIIVGTVATLVDLDLGEADLIVDYDGVPEKKKDRMQATKEKLIRLCLADHGKFVSLTEL